MAVPYRKFTGGGGLQGPTMNVSYEQLLEMLRRDLATNSATMNTTHLIPASWQPWATIAIYAIFGLLALSAFFGVFFIVSTQEVAIVERFGKFTRKSSAGLRFKLPFIESVADKISLMLEQHSVKFSSITKDKVSVMVYATVQYKVVEGREYDAFYLLDEPHDQIESFFFDIMRSQIPVLTLDELYEAKDSISASATSELKKDMEQFGYAIPRVLITSIDPDEKVKAAMNDINAAQRESAAATARGEAQKILQVKNAEAQAEADRLRGTGIANQRIEITRGFQKSVEEMKAAVPTADDGQIMAMLTMTQYLETVEKLAAGGKTNVIMIPHSPGGVADLRQQLVQAGMLTKSIPEELTLKQ